MELERDEYKTYEAVLMPPEQNREILRGRVLQSHSIGGRSVVSWRLRSNLIQSGDYIVRLTGDRAGGSLENVESSQFLELSTSEPRPIKGVRDETSDFIISSFHLTYMILTTYRSLSTRKRP